MQKKAFQQDTQPLSRRPEQTQMQSPEVHRANTGPMHMQQHNTPMHMQKHSGTATTITISGGLDASRPPGLPFGASGRGQPWLPAWRLRRQPPPQVAAL
eukprot:8586769-Lingulodinium_polyedra.AAC.2